MPPTPAEDVIDDYDLVEITAPVVTGESFYAASYEVALISGPH